MSLVAVMKNILCLIAVVLLNSISFIGHASAIPAISHEMKGMSHTPSDISSCETLCRTAVVTKEENVTRNDEKEEDDEPISPLYIHYQFFNFDGKSVNQHLYAAEIKLPPKIPVYILYGVFRA